MALKDVLPIKNQENKEEPKATETKPVKKEVTLKSFFSKVGAMKEEKKNPKPKTKSKKAPEEKTFGSKLSSQNDEKEIWQDIAIKNQEIASGKPLKEVKGISSEGKSKLFDLNLKKQILQIDKPISKEDVVKAQTEHKETAKTILNNEKIQHGDFVIKEISNETKKELGNQAIAIANYHKVWDPNAWYATGSTYPKTFKNYFLNIMNEPTLSEKEISDTVSSHNSYVEKNKIEANKTDEEIYSTIDSLAKDRYLHSEQTKMKNFIRSALYNKVKTQVDLLTTVDRFVPKHAVFDKNGKQIISGQFSIDMANYELGKLGVNSSNWRNILGNKSGVYDKKGNLTLAGKAAMEQNYLGNEYVPGQDPGYHLPISSLDEEHPINRSETFTKAIKSLGNKETKNDIDEKANEVMNWSRVENEGDKPKTVNMKLIRDPNTGYPIWVDMNQYRNLNKGLKMYAKPDTNTEVVTSFKENPNIKDMDPLVFDTMMEGQAGYKLDEKGNKVLPTNQETLDEAEKHDIYPYTTIQNILARNDKDSPYSTQLYSKVMENIVDPISKKSITIPKYNKDGYVSEDTNLTQDTVYSLSDIDESNSQFMFHHSNQQGYTTQGGIQVNPDLKSASYQTVRDPNKQVFNIDAVHALSTMLDPKKALVGEFLTSKPIKVSTLDKDGNPIEATQLGRPHAEGIKLYRKLKENLAEGLLSVMPGPTKDSDGKIHVDDIFKKVIDQSTGKTTEVLDTEGMEAKRKEIETNYAKTFTEYEKILTEKPYLIKNFVAEHFDIPMNEIDATVVEHAGSLDTDEKITEAQTKFDETKDAYSQLYDKALETVKSKTSDIERLKLAIRTDISNGIQPTVYNEKTKKVMKSYNQQQLEKAQSELNKDPEYADAMRIIKSKRFFTHTGRSLIQLGASQKPNGQFGNIVYSDKLKDQKLIWNGEQSVLQAYYAEMDALEKAKREAFLARKAAREAAKAEKANKKEEKKSKGTVNSGYIQTQAAALDARAKWMKEHPGQSYEEYLREEMEKGK